MVPQAQFLPLYRALVEYAQDMLGVIDLSGRIRYLSPSAAGLSSGRPAQLVGRKLDALCQIEDLPRFQDWLARLQRSDAREWCEVRLGAEGAWRRIKLSGLRIREDESTEVIAISGHDVTLEVEALRALKSSEQRYQGAFDYAPIGKALIDASGEVVEANRTLAEMLDCWVSELIGADLLGRFSAEDASLLRQDLVALKARQDTVRERELRVAPAGGRGLKWLLINIAPIWDDQGGLEHFIVQLQDFTARRQAEQDLRDSNADLLRSNEELKRFAFIASHDLREPLRGIGSSIQLVARRYKEALGEDGLGLVEQAVSGVKRLQALMDELVIYTEQMRGGEIQRQTVVISRVVEALRQEFAARLQASNGSLDAPELPTILGDPEQIRQIFWHLIDNALKFARPQVPPQIRISARWGQGQWHFTVADNGIGIAPEHHSQVFEVFRRLDADTPGTGMGLATVRKMVERHGGSISLESTPGQGTRVNFSLPPE